MVTEEAMAAVYGAGRDPITETPLGRAYPTYRTATERIAARTAALPPDLDDHGRAESVAQIVKVETERRMPGAVAGFDLTFTAPKSASVLWALGDPKTQAAVVAAHRAAVDEALAFVEDRALFTRVGARSCAQVPTRGMVAAAFDHWDTRTADPNLHTHVVIANKVQGLDGRWRSVDSRALHHAVVAVSEIYDDLLADHLARELPVTWSWRPRGPRRTPAFEVDGVDDNLLAEFSTRSSHIDAAMQEAVTDFHAAHGRGPNRVEVLRLRQHITRTTRPAKTAHPLAQLLHAWRDRAARLTGRSPEQLTDDALTGRRRRGRTGTTSAARRGRVRGGRVPHGSRDDRPSHGAKVDLDAMEPARRDRPNHPRAPHVRTRRAARPARPHRRQRSRILRLPRSGRAVHRPRRLPSPRRQQHVQAPRRGSVHPLPGTGRRTAATGCPHRHGRAHRSRRHRTTNRHQPATRTPRGRARPARTGPSRRRHHASPPLGAASTSSSARPVPERPPRCGRYARHGRPRTDEGR